MVLSTAASALPAAYAALCNPPRRAKRAVVDHSDEHDNDNDNDHDDPVRTMQTERHIVLTAHTDVQASDAATGMDPPQTAPKRRGRKSGALSRSARESQRKMNHSRIEKARRLKINDALAALRELVPVDFDRSAQEDNIGGKRC